MAPAWWPQPVRLAPMLCLLWLATVGASTRPSDGASTAKGLGTLQPQRSVISHTQSAIEAQWKVAVPDPSVPRGFRLALTGATGEMLLSWSSPAATASAQTLRYGATQALPHSCKPEVVPLPEDPSSVTLRCLMAGLAPYTRYYYAVRPSSSATPSALSFISPPLTGAQFTEYPLRVLAFGDVDWTDGRPGDPAGSNPADTGNSRRVTAAACHDVAFGRPKGTGTGAPRPPFNATLTLHVGDISYSGPNSGGNTTLGAMLWDVFLAEQECLSSTILEITTSARQASM